LYFGALGLGAGLGGAEYTVFFCFGGLYTGAFGAGASVI
jgi:hypothetical protein